MLRSFTRLTLGAALCAALATTHAAAAQARDASGASDAEHHAWRILQRHLARREFPGAMLALYERSGASFTLVAGRAHPERAEAAIDTATPWIIGSTTKTFVAVVVLQLAQQGRLDLDATLGRQFPELPLAANMTARQLLQHTAGLNEYLHTDTVSRDARRAWSARELIGVAVSRGAVGTPGAGYHYANTHYLVLGELIERVTSRPWYAEVRTRIVEPLGLMHTGYPGEPGALPIGAGFVRQGGRFVEGTERWHPSLGGAAGGMYSTVGDLLRFTRALFAGRLLDARRMAEMQAFVPGEDIGSIGHAYGLGLERYTLGQFTLLGHMGSAGASGSFIGWDPASGTAVAVATNAENPGPPALIGAELVGELTGHELKPPPMPAATLGWVTFPYRTLSRTANGERIGEVRVQGQQASATWPVVANAGRTRLELSASYQRLQFDDRGFTHPLRSVQAIGLSAFLRQRLDEHWGLLFVAAPGYADDFRGAASLDALNSTLVTAGSYRFGPGFEAGLGIAVQNIFGEPLPMPVGALDWTITERLWLRSIVPVSAELTWLPREALGLRASLQVSGSSYHGAERIYGVRNPQLNYSAAAFELGARWFVLPGLHVTVHGGHTLFRRFEFSDGRDPAPGGEFHLRNGAVFGIDLGTGG